MGIYFAWLSLCWIVYGKKLSYHLQNCTNEVVRQPTGFVEIVLMNFPMNCDEFVRGFTNWSLDILSLVVGYASSKAMLSAIVAYLIVHSWYCASWFSKWCQFHFSSLPSPLTVDFPSLNLRLFAFCDFIWFCWCFNLILFSFHFKNFMLNANILRFCRFFFVRFPFCSLTFNHHRTLYAVEPTFVFYDSPFCVSIPHFYLALVIGLFRYSFHCEKKKRIKQIYFASLNCRKCESERKLTEIDEVKCKWYGNLYLFCEQSHSQVHMAGWCAS